MFFKKKSKKEEMFCSECDSSVGEKFSFCPYCGSSLLDEAEEMRNFGMLGRGDMEEEEMMQQAFAQTLGMTDKFIGTLMQSLMKNLDIQVRASQGHQIKNMPNGISIKIAPQQPKKQEKQVINRAINDEQLQRISALPRTEAKARMRRFNDSVVYELATSGILSTEDVFISKLESGYEVKAIGKGKLYVNSLPVNLPLRGFSINERGLVFEFGLR